MIDAEFACVGPIAFDVGKMVGNLLLAFFASDGLASAAEPRRQQRRWLLQARRQAVSVEWGLGFRLQGDRQTGKISRSNSMW